MTSDEAALLTTALDSSIRQVGWQKVAARAELIGQRQRRQHFGTLQTIGGLRAVGVISTLGASKECQKFLQEALVMVHSSMLGVSAMSTLSSPTACDM